MGVTIDSRLDAQKCLLGMVLNNPDLMPRLAASGLREKDFKHSCAAVFSAMMQAYDIGNRGSIVTPAAVLHGIGDTEYNREIVQELLDTVPGVGFDDYVSFVRDSSKLSQLVDLGVQLEYARTVEEATETAGKVNSLLMDRPDFHGYDPADLLTSWFERHSKPVDQLPLPFVGLDSYLHIQPGNMVLLMAEPSGGKTAFALQLMWAISRKKRVLFISLETSKDIVFDRMSAFIANISMNNLMSGQLPDKFMENMAMSVEEIERHTFRILPADMGMPAIKAAAISYRADVVMIDYLGLIQPPQANRPMWENYTQLSHGIHRMAQSTGMVVFALSQVSTRDMKRSPSPLTLMDARGSGDIEADCDVILAVDKFVESGVKKAAPQCNRVLRCLKNKNGPLFNTAMHFDGLHQSFSKIVIPDAAWEKVKADGDEKRRAKAEARQGQGAEDKPQNPDQMGFYEITGKDEALPF